MIAVEQDRMTVLRQLVSDAHGAAQTMALLSKFDWDYDGVALTFQRIDLHQPLQHYLNQKLTAAQLEYWANSIECREDIAIDINDQALLEDLIYELANPELTQPLTPTRAQQMLENLSND